MASKVKLSGVTSDGDYFSPEMSADDSTFELASMLFTNGSGDIVVPTAGTVTVTGSADGVVFKTMDFGTFDADSASDANQRMPLAYGLMTKFKITLSGIVGATNFQAVAWRE